MRELSHHILDVLENSVEAGAARIVLALDEDLEADWLTVRVEDNGLGMNEKMVKSALDPFVTTRATRHVGLGLPLFAATARRCEGDLSVRSALGEGTRIEARMRHGHLDRPPLGAIVPTLMAILLSARPVDLVYRHRVGGREFDFDSSDVRREIGETPFSHPKVRDYLMRALEEGEQSLQPSWDPDSQVW